MPSQEKKGSPSASVRSAAAVAYEHAAAARESLRRSVAAIPNPDHPQYAEALAAVAVVGKLCFNLNATWQAGGK